MTYFTTWDINVFLCLVSLGLPRDLVESFVKKIGGIHRQFELEGARDFHCDRGKFVDMSEWHMLYFSRAELSDRDWHFPKVISRLESIPVAFHNSYSHLVKHFNREIKYHCPNDRINYLQDPALPAGFRHRHRGVPEMVKWFDGFHPGRFFLMDYQYINSFLKWNTLYSSALVWRVSGTTTFCQWYNQIFGKKKHIEYT